MLNSFFRVHKLIRVLCVALPLSVKSRPPEEEDQYMIICMASGTVFNDILTEPVVNELNETFTIHNKDFDLQNIPVEEKGKIMGVVDWDIASATPRCIGAAAVPMFLRNNWFPPIQTTYVPLRISKGNYHSYHQIYAAAMAEAENEDARFTIESAPHQTLMATVTIGSTDLKGLIDMLLREVSNCRVDARDLKLALSQSNWITAKE